MASVTLDKIWKEVKAMLPDEQRQLRERLNALLEASPSRSADDELERRLFEAGLLSEIKPPPTDVQSYQSYKPVEVRGNPVSETIVEEHR